MAERTTEAITGPKAADHVDRKRRDAFAGAGGQMETEGRPDGQKPEGGPLRAQWIGFPDLLRAYELALTAPGIGFEIIHLVGESSQRRWDLSAAERALGYRPEYRLEDLGYRLEAEAPLLETHCR